MNNITAHWISRYTEELKAIGVEVPEGISYEDLKALHKQHHIKPKATKKAAPKKKAEPVMSEEAIAAAIEKYMKGLSAPKADAPEVKDEPGMSESQMVRVMRAMREDTVNKGGGLNPNYIDPKDQLAKPVRFFAPYKYFFIRSKELAGYKVALPNSMKVVAFQPNFPKTVMNGGRPKRQYSCYVDVSSHSLYRWMTGKDIDGNEVGLPDPDFRVKYFLDPSEMIVDGFHIWQRIYDNHRSALENKPLHELIRLAEIEAETPPSSQSDKAVLASRVARVRANKEFKAAKVANDTMREQSRDIAAAMFGQTTNPMPLPT